MLTLHRFTVMYIIVFIYNLALTQLWPAPACASVPFTMLNYFTVQLCPCNLHQFRPVQCVPMPCFPRSSWTEIWYHRRHAAILTSIYYFPPEKCLDTHKNLEQTAQTFNIICTSECSHFPLFLTSCKKSTLLPSLLGAISPVLAGSAHKGGVGMPGHFCLPQSQ